MERPGTAAVLGVQSCTSKRRLDPARAEDALPSWRSMRNLTVKEITRGVRSGSFAENG
jgi:hypothetical protein